MSSTEAEALMNIHEIEPNAIGQWKGNANEHETIKELILNKHSKTNT